MKRSFVCSWPLPKSLQRYTVTVHQHVHFVTMLFFFVRDNGSTIHRESPSGTINAGLVSRRSTGQIWTHPRDGGEATCRRRHPEKTVLGATPWEACMNA